MCCACEHIYYGLTFRFYLTQLVLLACIMFIFHPNQLSNPGFMFVLSVTLHLSSIVWFGCWQSLTRCQLLVSCVKRVYSITIIRSMATKTFVSWPPRSCLICNTHVHNSNKMSCCRTCSGFVHTKCTGYTEPSDFIRITCLADNLPFLCLSKEDEFYNAVGVLFHEKKTLVLNSGNKKLNLNPHQGIDDNLINNPDIDVDSNHYAPRWWATSKGSGRDNVHLPPMSLWYPSNISNYECHNAYIRLLQLFDIKLMGKKH